MSKKLIIAIVAVVAVVVLALGIGVTVFADTPTPPIAITTQDTVIQSVAKTLGVTTDQMINAVTGAKQALAGQKPTSDVFYAKVAELLSNIAGKTITKDQVIAAFKQAGIEAMDANTTAMLDRAVAAGKINADEGKQIKDWLAARPSAADKLIGGFRGFGGRCWGFMKSGIGGFGGMGKFGGPGMFKGGQRIQAPATSPSAN